MEMITIASPNFYVYNIVNVYTQELKMSFWYYSKIKDGHRNLWIIDFDPLIIMTLIALVAALIIPNLLQNPSIIVIFTSSILAMGMILLIIAKISLYRRGIWISFGPRLMTKEYATLYKIAYVFLAIGVLMLLLSWYVSSKI